MVITRAPRPSGAARLCLLALLAAAGCGPRLHKTYPVEGKVVFKDGTPLTGGSVEFQSDAEATKGLNASGPIRPDGTFRLYTYRKFDGAVAGPHRAIVIPPVPDETGLNEGKKLKPRIHPRFQRYEQSRLEFTVTPKGNRFNIEVEGP